MVHVPVKTVYPDMYPLEVSLISSFIYNIVADILFLTANVKATKFNRFDMKFSPRKFINLHCSHWTLSHDILSPCPGGID